MVEKVVTGDSDFENEWKKKKAEMSKLHKASNALRCVFSKLTGKK